MRSRLIIMCAAMLFAAQASAQPIHGHPQKDRYNSPEEWPFLSAQTHWKPANRVVVDLTNPPPTFWPDQDPNVGHTHMECWAPIYAETTLQPFTMPCRVQLVHVEGKLDYLWGHGVSSIRWVEPDGSTINQLGPWSAHFPKQFLGDPLGIRVLDVLITIDPAKGRTGYKRNDLDVPDHGWWHPNITARTKFFDGRSSDTSLRVAFFSTIDTAQPIATWATTFHVGANGVIGIHGGAFGHSASGLSLPGVFLPILGPLTSPWVLTGTGFSYGVSANMPDGTMSVVANRNLHHGINGTTVVEASGHIQATQDVILDPASLGAGTHTVTSVWHQSTDGSTDPNLATGMEFTSIFVVRVSVGGDVPPPPPPAPTETWSPVMGVFEKSSTTGAVRLVIGGVVIATWP